MVERRRFPRTNVYKPAKILASGRSFGNCVVRNVSSHGARVQLQSTAGIPVEFDLSFDTGRTFRKCHLVWQTSTDVGLYFEPQAH